MFIEGLEEYMIPCITNKFLGFECLGCGAQRAAALLFRGEFVAAFKMYPAIYSLLLFAAYLIGTTFFKLKASENIKIILVILNVFLIVGNFLFKFI